MKTKGCILWFQHTTLSLSALAAKALKMKIKAPVKIGDVIARDIDGAGADLIATRSIEAAC